MNGKGANERVLFHGTSKESSDKIAAKGFNRYPSPSTSTLTPTLLYCCQELQQFIPQHRGIGLLLGQDEGSGVGVRMQASFG